MLANHCLLAEIAELFGVLMVTLLLVAGSFMLLTLVTETGLFDNLKSKSDSLKTAFFQKYTKLKATLKNFF